MIAGFLVARNFRLFCLILLCILIVLTHHFSFSISLHPPQALFAYNEGIPSNFTLMVKTDMKDECFEYHSSNEGVISITPLFEDNCSKKAILSSVANLISRETTEISVTSKSKGQTVFFHAITDKVFSIELKYVTNELFLGGPPVKISVIAKDKEGHIFDSIDGLQIDWKVIHKSEEGEEEVIRVIELADPIYEYLNNDMVKRNLNSTSIFVEASRLGNAFISASLVISSKPVLHTEEVELRVLSNLFVRPKSPLYLVRQTSADLSLKKFGNEEAALEDFIIDVDDSNVVDLDNLHLEAKEYGDTLVVFKNKNSNEAASLDVHVVKLARIDITISSGNFTALEEMKMFEVKLNLFDDLGNKIHPSPNMLFTVSFPAKLFHVIFTTNNGTYSVVKSISPGKGVIRAEYKGIVLEDGSILKEKDDSISRHLDVQIFQKLSVFPPALLLPILEGNAKHDIPLKVSGGTGDYIYALSDYKVARIIEKGPNLQLQIDRSDLVNELILTVTDKKNLNFVTTAIVSLQYPIDIDVYPTVTETTVGNLLILPLALLGYEDKEKNIIRKFDDCAKCNVTLDIIEKYVLSLDKEAAIPAFGKGCISLQFRCKAAGYSRVNIKYVNGMISYNTTTILACFKPLKPVHPVRVAIIPLGGSMEVAFEGGPRRYPLFKEGYQQKIEPSNPDILKVSLIKDPVRYNKDLTVFRVSCMDLGENVIFLRIENSPSATLKHPAKSEASIKLVCAEPHSLHLKLFQKKAKKELKDDNIVKVPFYGDKTFSVDVLLKDVMGRTLFNMSSFEIKWSVSDKKLAYPVAASGCITHENAVAGYRKITRNFQEFKMTGKTGHVSITAKIVKYKKEVLAKEGLERYKEIGEISKTLNLKLVSLRDINAGLYDPTNEEKTKDDDGFCENDSCSS